MTAWSSGAPQRAVGVHEKTPAARGIKSAPVCVRDIGEQVRASSS